MSDETIRVLVADDHAVVREGIRHVLHETEGMEVVGEASDGDETLRLVAELDPDLVVLDLSMPGHTGVEVTRELRQSEHPVAILVLSMHDAPEYVFEAVRAGADGYILKDAGPRELRDAARAVAGGGEYFSPRVTRQLSVAVRSEMQKEQKRARLDQLTPREREVLQRVAAGLTSREIAEEFGISPRTVESHRESLMRKLRARNAAELARFAAESGLS
ncbi:MAG: DNA-binding response regulator [Gemmatimonadetes bacterium]|nr:MAG: DNA-binding response regulator [Gemmatimonadota bacterium]